MYHEFIMVIIKNLPNHKNFLFIVVVDKYLKLATQSFFFINSIGNTVIWVSYRIATLEINGGQEEKNKT